MTWEVWFFFGGFVVILYKLFWDIHQLKQMVDLLSMEAFLEERTPEGEVENPDYRDFIHDSGQFLKPRKEEWLENNLWFGQDLPRTRAAMQRHYTLIDCGVLPSSNEYWTHFE